MLSTHLKISKKMISNRAISRLKEHLRSLRSKRKLRSRLRRDMKSRREAKDVKNAEAQTSESIKEKEQSSVITWTSIRIKNCAR